jgi:ABC-type Fe3+-hydroxamate transport system substrate-binding protein
LSLRVVSLVPSLTETLLAWGVVPVACTRFCEQPSIAHVGGTKNPDLAVISTLAPDLVLMDREENRREDAEGLASAGIEVFATHVRSVDDVDPMMADLRSRLGLAPMAFDADPAAAVPVELGAATAFVAIWRRPWMTCNRNTYGSSLLASIGVTNVFADHSDSYPTVTLDEVAHLAPRVVLLPSEPYPFTDRHVAELRQAVKGAEVRLIDGQDLFWWGARTRAARARLAQAIAPRRFG